MGRTDATLTTKISFSYPTKWTPKLEALKDVYGALSIQDVIRSILAGFLKEKETEPGSVLTKWK